MNVFTRPQDKPLDQLTEAELADCLKDQLWRLNHLYQIVDKYGQVVTFTMNWAQQALYADLWYLNIVLKARQLGFTTFILIYALDCCLFNENFRAGVVAHNKEDAQIFFRDKVKFAYDHLPEAIRAECPTISETKQELMFHNNSSIRVATSMRSGTLNLLHVSEFGKICRKFPDKAKEIVTGSLQAVQAGQMIFIESTAEGREGYFFDYCSEAEKKKLSEARLTALDFRFHFYGWTEHPEYELEPLGVVFTPKMEQYFEDVEHKLGRAIGVRKRAWYVKKWELLGEDMYREYPSTPEEAFKQSIQGAYYAQQFRKIYRDKRITKVPLVTGVPVDTYWDLGVNDTTCIVFAQRIGRECHIVDFYEANGEGLSHYAQVLRERATANGYQYGRHYGPHDIAVQELGTGQTRIETARALGIDFEVAPRLSVEEGIEATRKLLDICWFDEEKTDALVTALENYRKQWDDRLGAYRGQPLHDWASNPSDAFRTLGVCFDYGNQSVVSARPVHKVAAGGWT